ncbi:hypothetical protein N7U66_17865 [Lacinutrix neustonica]|uniref:C1q domain-containing protein n=1 Tax=Lacinutrix neustonica TaxID=2980107 RepID=A0A9E8MVD0_9FLAO|nr:hypothetical protein [Lacinutrix neustonica]WAC01741.1 hypothetical protein N7U66_17865 [Lacinutrix neustonica]
MKNTIYYFLLVLFVFNLSVVFGQVGINTTSPDASSALDITSASKGVLLPGLTTLERNAIINAANGLLIYNTDTGEFQFNSSTTTTPFWEAFNSTPTVTASPGESVKYSNTDVATNVNQDTAINLPVFGAVNWNDNTSLYTVNTTAHTLTINETGRYRLVINSSLFTNSNENRLAPQMRITVNGVQVGTFGSTGYIRINNGHQESSLHINEVLELTIGDVIAVDIAGEAERVWLI